MYKLFLLITILITGCRFDTHDAVLLAGDSTQVGASIPTQQKLLLSDDAAFLPIPIAISGTGFGHLQFGAYWSQSKGKSVFDKYEINVVFMALGQNDATLNTDPANVVNVNDMRVWLAGTIAMYATADHPLYWIIPHAGYQSQPTQQLLDVIALLHSELAKNPNAHELDFVGYVLMRGHTMSEVLQPNIGNVHLTDLGDDLWSDMIVETATTDAQQRELNL